MKKIVCLILLTAVLMCASASAELNTDRFLAAPDNSLMSGSVIFGMSDMISRTNGTTAGLMMMIYSELGYEGINYPTIVTMFGAGSFVPTTAKILTDTHAYFVNIGDLTKAGLVGVDQVANILVDKTTADMFRDMITSNHVQFTLIANGETYDFELSDIQKGQLSLIVDAFDEEIWPYLDTTSETYNAGLDAYLKRGYSNIAVSTNAIDGAPGLSETENEKYETLQMGAKGEEVKKMQNTLKALGYLTSSADGDFDSDTEKAVKSFQSTEGMNATGIADHETLKKLYSKKLPAPQDLKVKISKLSKNSIGTPQVYVQLTNISDRPIDRIDLVVQSYDAYDNLIKPYNRYNATGCYYDDSVLNPGKSSPSDWAWTLYDCDGAAKVKVAITKYHFKDGETITVPTSEYVWNTYEK